MKKGKLVISVVILFPLYFSACNSRSPMEISDIPSDTATIAKGEASFTRHCRTCHSFRQGGIGPKLGGLTDSVSPGWIKNFIRDPKKMIESKDKRTLRLMNEYKAVMPSFASFTDDELGGIIAFLNTQKKYNKPGAKTNGTEISNPVKDTIRLSPLIAGLELVTQFPPSGDMDEKSWARIAKLDFESHTASTFVVDLQGELYKLQNNKPILYMNMAKLKPKFIPAPGLATGFCSFAFHPGFEKNGLLYTLHSESTGSAKADFSYPDSIDVTMQAVVTEWKTNNPGSDEFSGTSRELLRVDILTDSHGAQEIAFNPLSKIGQKDYGMLYIAIGDGGSVQVGYPFLLHGIETIWGSILRIDPLGKNSVNGRYGIPPDNPFAQTANSKALKEIFVNGFRNPHRITWSKSGKMLAFNIGQAHIESINLVIPGHNYGWPVREGNFVFDPNGDLDNIYPLPPNDSIYKITYPVAEYDHGEGMVISGGYEYWGTTIPQLKGKLLFGDIYTGRLFYINMADIKQGKLAPVKEWKISINGTHRTLRELCGRNRVDLHFGRDYEGELYILTKADGKMYKLVSAADGR